MDNERFTGILCPIWTLSHKGDQGIGDLASLKKFIPWVSKAGVEFIQLLPINECDNSNSPYSAISSIALDPIYLDLSLIPEITKNKPLDGLPKSDKVDYQKVRNHKNLLLRAAFDKYLLEGTEDNAFTDFQKSEAEWLSSYSFFRHLTTLEGDSPNWKEWDASYNTPEKALKWFEKEFSTNPETYTEVLYYEWVQWHCFTQWKNLRNFAKKNKVKLMGDIPVGVSYCSADVFFEPENFQLDWYGGAPPETFFKDDAFAVKWGQNWGIPLYNDEYLRKTNFSWWVRRVQKHTEIFSMFRIDHILGLYRIYSFPWAPAENTSFLELSEGETSEKTGGLIPGFKPRADTTAKDAQLNLERGDEIISFIIQAANGADIIAEDLGMTPDYVRPHLEKRKISGFRVCHWELGENAAPTPTDQFPYYSFATFSTHDHPPITAVWNTLRQELNSQDPEEQNSARSTLKVLGQIAKVNLPQPLSTSDDIPKCDDEILWKLLHHLLEANSRYTALMITELLGTEDRFNTPSTVGDHNWTHRIKPSIEDLIEEPQYKSLQTKLKELILKNRKQL